MRYSSSLTHFMGDFIILYIGVFVGLASIIFAFSLVFYTVPATDSNSSSITGHIYGDNICGSCMFMCSGLSSSLNCHLTLSIYANSKSSSSTWVLRLTKCSGLALIVHLRVQILYSGCYLESWVIDMSSALLCDELMMKLALWLSNVSHLTSSHLANSLIFS